MDLLARLLFETLLQQLQRVGVALEAFAGDGGEAGQAGVAYLAEVLAGLHGADVDLHCGDGDGLEGVEDRHARVRVGRRVDDDTVDLSVRLLDFIDDAAFVVGLEDLDLVKALRGSGLLADLDQAVVVVAAIDARLANAEHVEVGAVDDECFHDCFLCGWAGGAAERKTTTKVPVPFVVVLVRERVGWCRGGLGRCWRRSRVSR